MGAPGSFESKVQKASGNLKGTALRRIRSLNSACERESDQRPGGVNKSFAAGMWSVDAE